MEFDEIEALKAKKLANSGQALYQFPGELIDSDEDYNGGDVEDNANNSFNDSASNFSWSDNASVNSECSFDSTKMIDGYKDYIYTTEKEEVR